MYDENQMFVSDLLKSEIDFYILTEEESQILHLTQTPYVSMLNEAKS